MQQPRQRRKRSEVRSAQTPMDLELDRQVNELMVSSYDAVAGKTSWQCAQCHFTSKVRSTVKEHIETHIEGFLHQCPYCVKTCKTRNALRVHVIRGHNKSSQMGQVQPSPSNSISPPKICYEPQSQPPQPQQQNSLQQQQQQQSSQNPQQQGSSSQQSQSGLQHSPSSQSGLNSQPQPTMVVVAKKTQVDPKLYEQAEQHQATTRQSPSPTPSSSSSTTSSSSIMNHPMIGRPMYGHPMMMGHPMI